jgi:xanthine dehydrogenase accessory factor
VHSASWHNRVAVETSLAPLLPLFQRERAAGRALALGVLVHTIGSTYAKPGALILIAASGEYAGLISGGCLEGDLREHARGVIDDGLARQVRYDLRGTPDLLWGLGLGCEGAMEILLLRVGADNAWQPLAHLAASLAAHEATAIGVVVHAARDELAPGSIALPARAAGPQVAGTVLATTLVQTALERCAVSGQSAWLHDAQLRLFVLPLTLPPRVLVLGAGPDAVPVVDFAVRLGWKVTVADHRAAYAAAAHFPGAERVIQTRPEELAHALDLNGFAGAVVMSHHLASDLTYLRVLARSAVPYVGLLGPAVRREHLLADLGADAPALAPRLQAPVGLPLGGRTPESIALAIVAQLHGFLFGPETAAGTGSTTELPVASDV